LVLALPQEVTNKLYFEGVDYLPDGAQGAMQCALALVSASTIAQSRWLSSFEQYLKE